MGKFYELRGLVELEDGDMVGKVIGVLKPAGAPSQVTGLTAVEITQSLVRLQWLNNGDAAAWIVRRDGTPIATVTSPTYSDTTVSASTTYDYDVAGVTGGVTGAFSTVLEVTTSAPATPDVPTGLVVSAVTYSSVALSWEPSAGATSYDVYRDTVFLATTANTSYLDTSVASATSYDYQVLASNSNGDSALSAAVTALTSTNGPPVWDPIPDQSGSVGTAVSINLNDYCVDGEGQPLTFSIVSAPVPGLQISSNGQLIVGTLTTAGSYQMIIRADDGPNEADTTVNWVVTQLADMTAPSIPQNAVATANGSTVTLTWEPSTDPVVPGEATTGVRRYRIRRNDVFISYADGPPFIETGVPDGTHTYHVRSEDNANFPAGGNFSANSNGAVVVVSTVSSAPDTPINFVASPISATRIDLSWSRGPGGAEPTDYDVDFSTTGASGPWTALPVTGTGTTFSHTGLTAIQHWYRLRANAGAISSGYTTATATPSGGTQSPDFIIGPTVDVVDCRALRDVNNVVRKVLPGEIIQINQRTADSGTPATVLEIQYPEGTAAQPIRIVPQPNTQVLFQRWNPAGNFVIQITGPLGNSVPVADRHRYGYITFDGFTTSSSVSANSFDGKKHGFKMLPSVNNPGQDNPTNVVKTKGFITHVRLRYFWFDMRNAKASCGGISKNENTFQRSVYPGTFRGPMFVENVLGQGIGSVYLGSNFGPGFLPSRSTKVEYCMFLNSRQTAILLKNYWDANFPVEVHHNIVKNSGDDPGPVIQRNSISITGSVGSCHHNWCENTGMGVIGNSENKVQAMRFDCNDGPYVAPFQSYPGYSSFEMKVYSNLIFRAVEGGMSFSSNNSRTSDPIAKYLAKVFSNTIDEVRNPSGVLQDAVSFSNVFSGSFCRNNIATRTAGYKNIPAADVARNIDDSNISRYTNVYSYSTYADYTSASESQKNYKLSTNVAVYGGSTLGVDLAETDLASAYSGSVPSDSLEEANDTTRSGGSYDMGALERA